MKFATSCSMVFGAVLLMLTGPDAVNAECSDVHIVFARGSGEMPGLGICGTPLVKGIISNLAGMSVSSYAVNYLASVTQTSAGPGATDMTNHVTAVAQQCPDTVFALGGYSQGASVTDISIGIKTMLGVGASIPETLAPRIKAIVTFGNHSSSWAKRSRDPASFTDRRRLSSVTWAIQSVQTASTRWHTSHTRWMVV